MKLRVLTTATAGVLLITLAACQSIPDQITAADVQRVADAVMKVVSGSERQFCALPPEWQAKALTIIRKKFPDAAIACASATGRPLVTGVPGW